MLAKAVFLYFIQNKSFFLFFPDAFFLKIIYVFGEYKGLFRGHGFSFPVF